LLNVFCANLGGFAIAPPLQEYINHFSVLIDSSPQVVLYAACSQQIFDIPVG